MSWVQCVVEIMSWVGVVGNSVSQRDDQNEAGAHVLIKDNFVIIFLDLQNCSKYMIKNRKHHVQVRNNKSSYLLPVELS